MGLRSQLRVGLGAPPVGYLGSWLWAPAALFFFIHSMIRSWLWAAPGTAVALRCARPLGPGWIRCSW